MGLHGVGVDLVYVPRFLRFARDHRRRLPEMFTRDELLRGAERMAMAFAVKEAALKAIGDLSGWELDWREIASPDGEAGTVALSGRVAAHARRLGLAGITASVSRFGEYAMASVLVLERRLPLAAQPSACARTPRCAGLPRRRRRRAR